MIVRKEFCRADGWEREQRNLWGRCPQLILSKFQMSLINENKILFLHYSYKLLVGKIGEKKNLWNLTYWVILKLEVISQSNDFFFTFDGWESFWQKCIFISNLCLTFDIVVHGTYNKLHIIWILHFPNNVQPDYFLAFKLEKILIWIPSDFLFSFLLEALNYLMIFCLCTS